MGVALLWSMVATASSGLSAQKPPLSGDAVIRSLKGEGGITIRTTSRLAGAIHSLTWNEKEFIDSHDHGRQLQSAINLDGGERMRPETFNPTEAGSRNDGAGPTSTSRLNPKMQSTHILQLVSPRFLTPQLHHYYEFSNK